MQNEAEKIETTTQQNETAVKPDKATQQEKVKEDKKLTIDEIVKKIVFEQKSIYFKEKINKAKEDKKYSEIFVIKNKKNENYFDIFLEKGSVIEEKRKKETSSRNFAADLSENKEEDYSLINDYIFDVYRVFLEKGKIALKKTTENEPIRSL